MNDLKNYYEVLEVPFNARSEDIYHSYQRAKSAYSNDSIALYSLMSTEECRNILDLVEEAYSILSDPNKRKRYDEARGLNREFTTSSYNTLADRISSIRQENTYQPTSSAGINTTPVSNMLREEFTINSPGTGFNNDSMKSTQTMNNSATNVSKLVTQKRFSLDFINDEEFEKEIDEASEFTGSFLQKIREYKNVDMDRLADMTKVSKMYLVAIEGEDFSKLPAPVYVRGFVFQYAKCLKLKPEVVANSYVARMKKLKP